MCNKTVFNQEYFQTYLPNYLEDIRTLFGKKFICYVVFNSPSINHNTQLVSTQDRHVFSVRNCEYLVIMKLESITVGSLSSICSQVPFFRTMDSV